MAAQDAAAQDAAAPLGTIPMRGATVGRFAHEAGAQFPFQLSTPFRDYVLIAATAEERDAWLHALQRANFDSAATDPAAAARRVRLVVRGMDSPECAARVHAVLEGACRVAGAEQHAPVTVQVLRDQELAVVEGMVCDPFILQAALEDHGYISELA